MTFLLLVVGLILLVKGADVFIDGACGIATKLGISRMIIGLTIVAFGTSAPELFINVQSALHGHTGLAIGNVLGSNIANILLICGVGATFAGLHMDRVIQQNFMISLGFGILLGVVSLAADRTIGLVGGIILLVGMAGYIYYMFRTSKNQEIQCPIPAKHPVWMLIAMKIGGLIALIYGSDLVVNNAITIAQMFGMSERLIGLTIIAIGTSLPELMTTIVSVRKGEAELGVGNIVGSNIFNIGLILSITAMITPVAISPKAYFDLFVYLAATILVLILLFTGRKYRITKSGGLLFLALYMIYIIFSVVRG